MYNFYDPHLRVRPAGPGLRARGWLPPPMLCSDLLRTRETALWFSIMLLDMAVKRGLTIDDVDQTVSQIQQNIHLSSNTTTGLFINEIAKTEDDLFVCDQVAGKIEAAKSECKDVKELILETDESTYFAKVITRKDGDDIIGTMGMAWDISSNITLLGSLVRVRDAANDSGDIEEIKKWAENGIAASRMRALIERMLQSGG